MGLVPLEIRDEDDEDAADEDAADEDEVAVGYQGFFADAETASRLAGPVRIVGVQTTWGQFSGSGSSIDFSQERPQLRMELSIDNLAGLIPREVLPVDGLDPLSDIVPLTVAPSQTWFGASD